MLRVTPFGIVTVEHCWTADKKVDASSPPLAAIVQDAAGVMDAPMTPIPDNAARVSEELKGFMV
jgi:hypothetical protein